MGALEPQVCNLRCSVVGASEPEIPARDVSSSGRPRTADYNWRGSVVGAPEPGMDLRVRVSRDMGPSVPGPPDPDLCVRTSRGVGPSGTG